VRGPLGAGAPRRDQRVVDDEGLHRPPPEQHARGRQPALRLRLQGRPHAQPDGVLGSYRAGLAGCDLNRTWKAPDRALHPTIFYTKALMERMRREREIAAFVDLQGHRAKKNVFIYGCDHDYWGDSPHPPGRAPPEPLRARPFPDSLGAECWSLSYGDCRFHVRRRKLEPRRRRSCRYRTQVPRYGAMRLHGKTARAGGGWSGGC
jgi:hypothetical protein